MRVGVEGAPCQCLQKQHSSSNAKDRQEQRVLLLLQ